MTQAYFLAAPKVGTVYCRDDEHMGRYEAAVVWCNIRSTETWEALLVTNENYHQLTAARYAQSVPHEDWRPVSWRWVSDAFTFAPAELEWNAGDRTWSVRETPAPPAPAVSLPAKSALPTPGPIEHHSTWRSRCRRKFPALDSEEGTSLLGEAWNEHKTKG